MDVYRNHQLRLNKLDAEDALAADLDCLLGRARAFVPALRPATETDPAVRRRLERLDRWGARTSLPLVLVLLEARAVGTISDGELEIDLMYIESFLVRRLITNHPTNNLNRTFMSAAVSMAREAPTPTAVQLELSNPRSYWSTDTHIDSAVREQEFYRNGRSDQRQAVLSWLEESFHAKEHVQLDKLTIEHVMPQTLSAEWTDALADELGGRESIASTHASLVHTLGNLTLTGYNSEMSNRPFTEKRTKLRCSGLRLNQQIAAHETWGFDEIADRGSDLATRIIETWPGPVAGGGAPESKPWQLLEQVVAAISAGRWASSCDVASAIGSDTAPVRSRLAAVPTDGAHRVIQADGTICAVSGWSDPERRETTQDVLTAEGLPFDSSGHAAPDHRLTVAELRASGGLDVFSGEAKDTIVEWTAADFAQLRSIDSGTARLITSLIDDLAANAGTWRSTSDLLPGLGVERVRLRGVLGAFTHLVRRDFGRDNWPMTYEWGPRLKLTAQAHYRLDPGLVEPWRQSNDPSTLDIALQRIS